MAACEGGQRVRCTDRVSSGRLRFSGVRNFSDLIGIAIICLPILAAGSDLRAGIEALAGDLIAKLPTDRRLVIAVTDFPDLQGVTSELSRYVAERVTTLFTQSQRVAVVERRHLSQVLAEFGWSQGDLLDPAKAPRLRQKAGVEGVLVGSLVDLGAAVEIEARLLALETGEVLAVATATIPKP